MVQRICPPKPVPTSSDRQRVILPGATLAGVAQSPDVQVFEELQSCEPNEAWYAPERAVNNPTRAEVLSYAVPPDTCVLITSYNFQAYAFSSIVAHGAVPIPDGELRGQMGFQFLVRGKVPGVTNFQIEPIPSTFARRQFRPPVTNRMRRPNETVPGDFARKRATEYGAAAGTGTTLLPPREGRHGDLATPAAFAVYDGEQVTMSLVVYRPVGIPLSFVEGKICGYIGPRTVLDKLLFDLQNSIR